MPEQLDNLVIEAAERTRSQETLITYLKDTLGVELPPAPGWDDVLDAAACEFVRIAEDRLAEQPWEDPTVAAMGGMIKDKEKSRLRDKSLHRVRQWTSEESSIDDQVYRIRQFAVLPKRRDMAHAQPLPFYLLQTRYRLPYSGYERENMVVTYVVDLDPLPGEHSLDRLDMPNGRSPQAGVMLADMLEAFRVPRAAGWWYRPYRFRPEGPAKEPIPADIAREVYELAVDDRLKPFTTDDRGRLLVRARDGETGEQFGMEIGNDFVHLEHIRGEGADRLATVGYFNFERNNWIVRLNTGQGYGRQQNDLEAREHLGAVIERFSERLGTGALGVTTKKQDSLYDSYGLKHRA